MKTINEILRFKLIRGIVYVNEYISEVKRSSLCENEKIELIRWGLKQCNVEIPKVIQKRNHSELIQVKFNDMQQDEQEMFLMKVFKWV